MEEIWDKIFKEHVRLTYQRHITHMMLLEKFANPPKNREKTAELFFERFGMTHFRLLNDGLAGVFGCGEFEGLAVDCGYSQCDLSPIIEGHFFQFHTSFLLDKFTCSSVFYLSLLMFDFFRKGYR